MSRLVSQAAGLDNGASNATDFQPLTTNPQNIPTQDFSGTTNVQPPTNSVNLQNQATRIITPNNPATSPKSVTEAKSSLGLTILLVLVVAGLIALGLWIKNRLKKPALAIQPLSANTTVQTPKPPATKPLKKTLPKKSKSKRKKRAKRG